MALLLRFKELAKSFLPDDILSLYQAKRIYEKEKALAGKTLQKTFSKIYSNGVWGRSPTAKFYSGPGSHDLAIVGPYVAAVRSFAGRFPARLDAVDLGCGDFNVGHQLRGAFAGYTACDVVPELIAENRRRFAELEVDFRVVDIATDPLPAGGVVLIRQVLQHLSNADISAALGKLSAYDHAIVTEHLPDSAKFRPNADKLSGAEIRLYLQSGIVLTEPPFNLRPLRQEVLCEVPASPGLIRTIAYQLR